MLKVDRNYIITIKSIKNELNQMILISILEIKIWLIKYKNLKFKN